MRGAPGGTGHTATVVTALTHRQFKNVYFRCELTGVSSPVTNITKLQRYARKNFYNQLRLLQ